MSVKKYWLSAILLCLILLLAACAMPILSDTANSDATDTEETGSVDLSSLPKNERGFADISVAQLAELMPQKEFTLINVHVPDQGDLPDTDLSIPYTEIDQFVEALPGKDATIVLYCQSGGMSTYTAGVLAEMGYQNIYELDGGFNAWRSAGNELLNTQ